MRAAEAASGIATVESYARPSLERLLQVAVEISTEEARRVADFLLAWYDAGTCGGFNIPAAWDCNPSIRHDMVVVFAWVISSSGLYPEALGYGDQFKAIARIWRPQVDEPQGASDHR
jgi:hypothetical protein